jgi:hypothetical protein
MRACLLFLILLQTYNAAAADSLRLLASRAMSARAITVDELGNVYAIHKDNTLARYNDHCDSTGYYRSTLNGTLGMVDATNPLRLLLYYPAFNKVQILDRQLALKSEVDLRTLHILSATAVATASDGNIWVYDPFSARILKLDETGNRVSESIDLRQQLSFAPKASFLLERDRQLYLCDTAQGVLVFDQFATYITMLPFKGIGTFQAFGHQLVFTKNDTLHSYDMQSFSEQLMPLPKKMKGIVDVSLHQRAIAILYLRELILYAWPPEKSADH